MTYDMKCDRCGGDLVDASPVDIYCPNDKCWEEDMALVRSWMKDRKEKEERLLLQKLKEKYPDEDNLR